MNLDKFKLGLRATPAAWSKYPPKDAAQLFPIIQTATTIRTILDCQLYNNSNYGQKVSKTTNKT